MNGLNKYFNYRVNITRISRPLSIAIISLLVSCAATRTINGQSEQRITVTNNSSLQLTDKPIAIKRSSIRNITRGTNYSVLISANNDSIPSQLDDLEGDNKWDELFCVADLPANSTN